MSYMRDLIWKLRRDRALLLSSYCYTKGLTRLPYAPLEVFIEPTNICNLECVICPQSAGLKRKKGMMSLDLFRDLLDKVAKSKALQVTLHFAGEPLLNKDIFEMVALAKKRGFYTRIHTNATLLSAEYAGKIIKSGLDEISLSFDDPRKEVYEKIRAKASYGSTLANINGFLALKKAIGAKKPFTILQRILIEDLNGDDPLDADYKSLFAGLPVDRFHTITAHNWAGNCQEHINEGGKKSKRLPCRAIWQRLAIGWDGKAFACCNEMDGKLTVGDLNDTSLSDIWNGKPMMRLRSLMREGRYDDVAACKDCDVLVRSSMPRMSAFKEGIAKMLLLYGGAS